VNIKLAENFRAVFYAPFYATHALGLFAEQGVTITLLDSASPGAGIAELAKGNIDVMWGGPLRVIKERDQFDRTEGSLVAFCEVAAKDPFFLLRRRQVKPSERQIAEQTVGLSMQGKLDAQSISDRTSKLNPQGIPFSLKDLPSLRFASVSEVPTPWLCLQQDLREAGVDPAKLNRVADSSMQENLDALLRGELDVIQVFEPYVSLALANEDLEVVHAASQRGYTAYTTFISTFEGMQRNRAGFEAMIAAIEQFRPWLAEHGPAELARVVKSFYPNVSLDILTACLTRYHAAELWTCRRAISRQGFARLAASMLDSGFIKQTARYEDCVAVSAYEA
jgi:NitT/TauT family transport system substrate-binding protein